MTPKFDKRQWQLILGALREHRNMRCVVLNGIKNIQILSLPLRMECATSAKQLKTIGKTFGQVIPEDLHPTACIDMVTNTHHY